MASWIRDGSLAWVIVNNVSCHLPRKSNWRVLSSLGYDGAVGTPEIKFAINSTRIEIPVSRYEDGEAVETALLQGFGYGVSIGISVQVPFVNFGWSTADDPGTGSGIFESPFCPEPLEAKHLAGMCLALTGSAIKPGKYAVGRQGSLTTLIFGDNLSARSIMPTSINAVAFVDGMSSVAGAFTGAGVEAVLYDLELKQSARRPS